jgi:hypothetical protein
MFESQCHTDPPFYNSRLAAGFKGTSIKKASIVHAGILKYNMIQSILMQSLVLLNIIAPANQNLV